MVTTSTGTTDVHGGAATPARGRTLTALEAAQRCHEDPKTDNLLSCATAGMVHALTAQSSHQIHQGHLLARHGTLAIRTAEYGRRHGNDLRTTASPRLSDPQEAADLAEEAELTARLEAVRNRREQRSGHAAS